MPGGPFDWLWTLLGTNRGTEANPIPLPPVQVVAGKGPAGQMTYPMRDALDNGFTRDTLYKLIGGPPERTEYRAVPQWPYGPKTLGATEGPPNDLNLILYGQLLNPGNGYSVKPLVAHEGGHIFSARNIDPAVISAVKKQWTPQVAADWGERGQNPEEMFAEAFSRAITFLGNTNEELRASKNPRARLKELQDIEESYSPPGTALMVKYLLQTPTYAEHSINKLQTRTVPAPRRAVKR